MSAPTAIEVIVMSAITSETKASGKVRKVTFLLPNDGEHPFEGMVGDRLHIVPVRINDDETPADMAGQDGEASALGMPEASRPAASPSAPKKAWADLPPSQQAAIRCSEAGFKVYLVRQRHWDVADTEEAAERVREWCGVNSRKELDTNHRARMIWYHLDTEYLQATGRLAVAHG